MNKIDLERSLLIVCTHPGCRIDLRTIHYFTLQHNLPVSQIIAPNLDCTTTEKRNRIYEGVVLPRIQRYEWFIFMDDDTYPTHLTDPFLHVCDNDVVGCQYETGNRSAWLLPNQFHMGLVRMKASIAELIKPPWFMFEYNDKGTKITNCDCGYFRKKLLMENVTITRRGYVEHKNEKRWLNCT